MGLMMLGSVMVVSTDEEAEEALEDDSEDLEIDAAKAASFDFASEDGEDAPESPSILDQFTRVETPSYVSEGTDSSDTLWGDDTDEMMNGFDDDDLLYGEGGEDDLRGELGEDTLDGGEGDDTLHGGEGDDLLYGGTGSDDLYGHDGDDRMDGGEGDDSVNGGLGNDTIEGGSGADALHGRHGDDQLSGGEGEDTLFGGWGDDTLDGRDGSRDFLNGGDGEDHLRVDEGDIASGGDGMDSFYLSGIEADEDAAQIMDFDPVEDMLVVLYDEETGEEDPEIAIEPDADNANLVNVTVDGVAVAQINSEDAPTIDQIVLMPTQSAGAVFGG